MLSHEQSRGISNFSELERALVQIKNEGSPLGQVEIANQLLETLPPEKRATIAKRLSNHFHPPPASGLEISFDVSISEEGTICLFSCYYYTFPQEGLIGSGMTYTELNDPITVQYFRETGKGQNALLEFASHLSGKHPSELTLDLHHTHSLPKPSFYSWEEKEKTPLSQEQEWLARVFFRHSYEPVIKYPQGEGFTVGFLYYGREDSLFFGEGSLLVCKVFREENPLRNGPIILIDLTAAPELSAHFIFQRMGTTFDRQRQETSISSSSQEELSRFIAELKTEARKEYEERLLSAYEKWHEENLPNVDIEETQLNDIQRVLVARGGWEGKRILEIGPGFGVFAFHLQQRNEVDVLEISSKTREFLGTIIEGNVYSLPPNQEYDLVIAERVLEEAFDTKEMLETWRKLLRKEGRLYTSWPQENDKLIPFATKAGLEVVGKVEIKKSPYVFYELQRSSVFPR